MGKLLRANINIRTLGIRVNSSPYSGIVNRGPHRHQQRRPPASTEALTGTKRGSHRHAVHVYISCWTQLHQFPSATVTQSCCRNLPAARSYCWGFSIWAAAVALSATAQSSSIWAAAVAHSATAQSSSIWAAAVAHSATAQSSSIWAAAVAHSRVAVETGAEYPDHRQPTSNGISWQRLHACVCWCAVLH